VPQVAKSKKTPVHVDGIDNSRLSHQFISGIRNSLEWDGGFLHLRRGIFDAEEYISVLEDKSRKN